MKRFVMEKYLKKCKMPAVLAICLLAVGLFALGCSDHNDAGTNYTETHVADNPNNDPQVLTGEVQGLVLNYQGMALAGLQASMTYDATGDGTANTVVSTTDGAGHYHFVDVPVSQSVDAGGVLYTITVTDPNGNYVTAYTNAVVNYEDLVDANQIANIGGEDQIVEGLMAEAATVTMRRPNITVIGFVEDVLTGQPIAGAAALIDENVVPTTHHLTNNSATTDSNGKFTIVGVPEAFAGGYRLTISATNYATSINAGAVVTPAGPTTIYLDGDNLGVGGGGGGADGVVATAIMLQNEADMPTADAVIPYVVSTNIPTTEMPTDLLDGPFTITWSEPMDTYVGVVLINTTAFRAPIANTLTWDSAGKVTTVTPDQGIPPGMGVSFTLNGFRDVAGNAYTGWLPGGITGGAATADVFSNSAAGVLATMSQGDSTLVIPINLAQVDTPDDLNINTGGAAAMVPQANNYNRLDAVGSGTGPGVGILGDAADETDTVSLEWDAATGARQYYVYAELNTGGFDNGFPVLVGGTAKSGSPDTDIDISLKDNDGTASNGFIDGLGTLATATGAADNDVDGVEDAIQRAIANGSGSIPLVSNENDGGVLFFDNGFTLNFAITAFNTEGVEGGFSNVVSAGDVTPPAVADQGFGFSTTSYTATTRLGDGTATTYFGTPPYAFRATTSATSGLDAVLGNATKSSVNDGIYSADDWTAATKSFTFNGTASGTDTGAILMNEDLDTDQTLALTAFSSGWSIASAVIPGVGDQRRDIEVTIDDVTQVKTGHNISFDGTLDEAGNPVGSGVEGNLTIYDCLGPFVTSAVTSAGTSTSDTLTIIFSETVDETTAETIGNYALSAGTIGTGTAELQTDGKTVIITTAADGDLTAAVEGPTDDDATATTLTWNGVKDEQPYVGSTLANTYTGGLAFAIEDGIPSLMTAATDTVVGGVINDTQADLLDSAWEVGDSNATAETYNVTITFSENTFNGTDAATWLAGAKAQISSVLATPSATYNNFVTADAITAATATTVTVTFQRKAAQVVAAGDKLSVAFTDKSDLSATAVITLTATTFTMTTN